jgi:hypothetical protein
MSPETTPTCAIGHKSHLRRHRGISAHDRAVQVVKSRFRLEEVMSDTAILLSSQMTPAWMTRNATEFTKMPGNVLQPKPDGATVKVLVEGIARAWITDFTNDKHFEASAEYLTEMPAHWRRHVRRQGT